MVTDSVLDVGAETLRARAQAAIRYADQLGDLEPDTRLQLAISGASVGRMQALQFQAAQALAILAIAESLAAITERLVIISLAAAETSRNVERIANEIDEAGAHE